MHILYLTDIHNLIQSGQLPVHQIDMQDKQGYCLFLKIADPEKEEYLLSDATLVCMYYIRENLDSGVWIGLPVLEDSINAFSISPQGTLYYKNEAADTYRDAVKEQYIAQTSARLQDEAMRRTAASAPEIQPGQCEPVSVSIQNRHTEPFAAGQPHSASSDNSALKRTVKRIIEKRLEKYSEILFDVDIDWLEETTVDGCRCIVIDLDKIDSQNAAVLSQMQLYSGARKSITRTGRQLLFRGYD